MKRLPLHTLIRIFFCREVLTPALWIDLTQNQLTAIWRPELDANLAALNSVWARSIFRNFLRNFIPGGLGKGAVSSVGQGKSHHAKPSN